jgi:hypothetical protein
MKHAEDASGASSPATVSQPAVSPMVGRSIPAPMPTQMAPARPLATMPSSTGPAPKLGSLAAAAMELDFTDVVRALRGC